MLKALIAGTLLTLLFTLPNASTDEKDFFDYFSGIVDNFTKNFVEAATKIFASVKFAAVSAIRAGYMSMGLAGAFTYFTHISRRWGMDMIKGAIIMAIIAEAIVPAL